MGENRLHVVSTAGFRDLAHLRPARAPGPAGLSAKGR
jgi:hypothetical protein